MSSKLDWIKEGIESNMENKINQNEQHDLKNIYIMKSTSKEKYWNFI